MSTRPVAATRSSLHVVTVCSIGRRGHLLRQLEAVRRWLPDAVHHTVQIGPEPFDVPGSRGLERTGPGPVNLAAARNAAGDAAARDGAEVIVFLDADCVPGPELGPAYAAAAAEHPGVLCGPVTYLRAEDRGCELSRLPALRSPHPARPDPPAGEVRRASPAQRVLFWSLSFALTSATWRELRRRFGGFCERFTGYGGEDTDFAMSLAHEGIPLQWVGGADAFHQWHPVSSPPVEHLDDILRNGEVFARRWGWWPMEGWFEAFEQRGLVVADGPGWRRADGPPPAGQDAPPAAGSEP
ncbi:glycosyltransferase family 2 protein [Kocuria palustris]|uniref:glycosyltransferase family 2 protein n=1 Tax=Kocuria palustris TaxID=71999 RepID=UPI0021B4C47C|nr:galactosyltransferase-related protein [Kocuria palustris]